MSISFLLLHIELIQWNPSLLQTGTDSSVRTRGVASLSPNVCVLVTKGASWDTLLFTDADVRGQVGSMHVTLVT